MFDFEKLEVYQKAKHLNKVTYQLITQNKNVDRTTKDQFRRAAFSIMLNIAEGSSRFSKPDRRNFYVIARGSAFEYAAILDFLKEEELVSLEFHTDFYNRTTELSKMLYAMIRNLS